ncbi:hypothetical protein GAY28_28545, partial [Azospirillum brasilense]|nr:hypothetical protein [Azospirillum brasilense]
MANPPDRPMREHHAEKGADRFAHCRKKVGLRQSAILRPIAAKFRAGHTVPSVRHQRPARPPPIDRLHPTVRAGPDRIWEEQRMRIAIMGAGAVGGYFGARLAATHGAEVHFIARGRHLEAIRRDGLRIESEAAPLHLTDVRATDDPAEVGPVDLVLFAVKLWDTDRAAEACRPLVKPGTVVVTVQNGVTGMDTLCQILGREHVAGGGAPLDAPLARPGGDHPPGNTAPPTLRRAEGGHPHRADPCPRGVRWCRVLRGRSEAPGRAGMGRCALHVAPT